MHACVYYGHQNVFTKRMRIEEMNERKHFMASFPEQTNMNFVPCKHKAQENYLFRSIFKGYKGD